MLNILNKKTSVAQLIRPLGTLKCFWLNDNYINLYKSVKQSLKLTLIKVNGTFYQFEI